MEVSILTEAGVQGVVAVMATTGTAGTTTVGDGMDTVASRVVIVAGVVIGRRSTRRVDLLTLTGNDFIRTGV